MADRPIVADRSARVVNQLHPHRLAREPPGWVRGCRVAGIKKGGPRQLHDRLGFLVVPRLWGFPGTPRTQVVTLPTRTRRLPRVALRL